MNLLSQINSPNDLKLLREDQLINLSDEVRGYIMNVISKEGGHFGGGLGVVELTIALHYLFETPYDRLIWDIGHQAYPHKVLTGRRDELPTIRKTGGLSPFLKIQESIYDHFGAGHTATSLSAALGVATARDLNKQNYHVVAIIGDGAMTGGIPFEALNNIGEHGRNLIVILNDNTMSIDPNCGSLCTHFADLAEGKKDNNLFKAFGLNYLGPVDGHNIKELLETLEAAKNKQGPQLIHVKTIKGHKWPEAETSVTRAHAISLPSTNPAPKFNKVYGNKLVELGMKNPDLVAITPAMASGSSMLEFQKAFPERFFDVGIAEQHAVTFAAGLAREGKTPFCTIYSTFLQRAYDQIIHDVCIQNLPVRFMIDRGGLVGADGPTHHGVFDLSYLRCLPEMVIASPRDEAQFEQLLEFSNKYDTSPLAIRYPRGHGIGDNTLPSTSIALGKGQVLQEGVDIAVFCVGPWGYDILTIAKELKDQLSIRIVDMQFVKPLDEDLLKQSVYIKHWVTLEDNAITGGFGSAISEWLANRDDAIQLKRFGMPDEFIPHGSVSDLRTIAGCDPEQIKHYFLSLLSR